MPNSAQTRREPQKGKNGFSAQKGFTLIELLIAVAIMAIVASLALPSYRSIVEKRQVTSGAEQLSAFLSAAQTEAIKRNQEVSIVCSVDTGQCETRALGKDVVEDDDDESLRTLLFVNLKADVVAVDYESEDLQVVFDPAGNLDYIAPVPIEIQLSSAQGEYALNVNMSATGRVSMCSDGERASKVVPGYDLCQVQEEG